MFLTLRGPPPTDKGGDTMCHFNEQTHGDTHFGVSFIVSWYRL
jgi:hypothetical protein